MDNILSTAFNFLTVPDPTPGQQIVNDYNPPDSGTLNTEQLKATKAAPAPGENALAAIAAMAIPTSSAGIQQYAAKAIPKGIQGFSEVASASAANVGEQAQNVEDLSKARNILAVAEANNARHVSEAVGKVDGQARIVVEQTSQQQTEMLSKLGTQIAQAEESKNLMRNPNATFGQRMMAAVDATISDIQVEETNRQLQTLQAAISNAQGIRANNFNMAVNIEKMAYDPALADAKITVAKIAGQIEVNKAKGESIDQARKSLSDVLSAINQLSGNDLQRQQAQANLAAARVNLERGKIELAGAQRAESDDLAMRRAVGELAAYTGQDPVVLRDVMKNGTDEERIVWRSMLQTTTTNDPASGEAVRADVAGMLQSLPNTPGRKVLEETVKRAFPTAYSNATEQVASAYNNVVAQKSQDKAVQEKLKKDKTWQDAQKVLDTPGLEKTDPVAFQRAQATQKAALLKLVDPYTDLANSTTSEFGYQNLITNRNVEFMKAKVPGLTPVIQQAFNSGKPTGPVQAMRMAMEADKTLTPESAAKLVADMSRESALATYEQLGLQVRGVPKPSKYIVQEKGATAAGLFERVTLGITANPGLTATDAFNYQNILVNYNLQKAIQPWQNKEIVKGTD